MGLFAAGYSRALTASIVGMSVKTMRKVFALECKYQEKAALIIRSKMMLALMNQVDAGKVSAIKALDKMLDAERARAIDARIGGQQPKQGKKAPAKGKKEEQQDAARGVEGLFGTRPPPPAAQLN